MPLDLIIENKVNEFLKSVLIYRPRQGVSKPIVNEGVLIGDVIALNCKGSFSGGMMTGYI